ncbi:MAG: hypothetical protein ACOVKB_08160, partial [Silanimonas sp.]
MSLISGSARHRNAPCAACPTDLVLPSRAAGAGDTSTGSGAMKRKSIALVLSMGAAASPAWADDPIATDRPDFVESSQTVGLGRWQIETSVA